jgi:hypothetical protein
MLYCFLVLMTRPETSVCPEARKPANSAKRVSNPLVINLILNESKPDCSINRVAQIKKSPGKKSGGSVYCPRVK